MEHLDALVAWIGAEAEGFDARLGAPLLIIGALVIAALFRAPRPARALLERLRGR